MAHPFAVVPGRELESSPKERPIPLGSSVDQLVMELFAIPFHLQGILHEVVYDTCYRKFYVSLRQLVALSPSSSSFFMSLAMLSSNV